jgi:3D (Asp-Asp-Asp) domain-containing protein
MRISHKFYFLLIAIVSIPVSVMGETAVNESNFNLYSRPIVLTDVYATGYYCVYNCELEGTQTITKAISNNIYILKASFLFGGLGIAMQGTGRLAADDDYIKYTGGGGCFVHIAGPDAGKNLNGQWVISPDDLRSRYARLGINDFIGFGNLALLYPENATYVKVESFTGSSGNPLTPWFSIASDSSLIPLGQTCIILFKNNTDAAYGGEYTTFKAEDIGSAIKGKHIDIYLGEGQSAIDKWNLTGGNRYVDIYPDTVPKALIATLPLRK